MMRRPRSASCQPRPNGRHTDLALSYDQYPRRRWRKTETLRSGAARINLPGGKTALTVGLLIPVEDAMDKGWGRSTEYLNIRWRISTAGHYPLVRGLGLGQADRRHGMSVQSLTATRTRPTLFWITPRMRSAAGSVVGSTSGATNGWTKANTFIDIWSDDFRFGPKRRRICAKERQSGGGNHLPLLEDPRRPSCSLAPTRVMTAILQLFQSALRLVHCATNSGTNGSSWSSVNTSPTGRSSILRHRISSAPWTAPAAGFVLDSGAA